jgi:hypothetical protein
LAKVSEVAADGERRRGEHQLAFILHRIARRDRYFHHRRHGTRLNLVREGLTSEARIRRRTQR